MLQFRPFFFFSFCSRGQEQCLFSLQPILASLFSSKIARLLSATFVSTFLTQKQKLLKHRQRSAPTCHFFQQKPEKGVSSKVAQNADSVNASSITLGRGQLCTCPAVCLWTSRAPFLGFSLRVCATRGAGLISAVRSSSYHCQRCSPACWPLLYFPPHCQKEEKKLALGVRGECAAPSCQGARVVAW